MKPLSRRSIFQAAGTGAAATLLAPPQAALAAPPVSTLESNVYTRIGVQPFINMTATYTINGGAPMLPEVKQSMEDASNWAVNLDELVAKAGARIAELLGGEAAIVTCGCAAALCHATAAAIAGGDPEKMKRLPDSSGMPRNEVLIAKQSRNDYDHAFRTAGGKLIEFDTPEQFHAALGHRTALVAVLGTGEAKGKLRLEQIAEAAHKQGVPVLVDAAAELPIKPNPYLSRGADLVGYSGGKILRGPQSAGILLGRKDLVTAAWVNGAPHHAYGRPMKVSKEETIGMLTAIERFVSGRNLEAEYRTWESWYQTISDAVGKVAGVTTRMIPPAGASPFPVMEVRWDPKKIPLTGDEVYELLLNGSPRIMSHAGGDSTAFVIRAVAMRPEHPPLVARRLAEVFGMRTHRVAPIGDGLKGTWEVDIRFTSGRTTHTWIFDDAAGGRSGHHLGQQSRGRFTVKRIGQALVLRSALPLEGMQVQYQFTGQ